MTRRPAVASGRHRNRPEAGTLARLQQRLRALLGGADGRFVVKTSLASSAIRSVGLVLMTVVTILFTRLMGAEEYGRLAFLLSGAFVIVLFTGLGLPTASSKLVPRYLSRGQRERAGHYFVFGCGLLLLVAMPVGCLFFLGLAAVPALNGFAFSFAGTLGLVVTISLMRFLSEGSRAFGFQMLSFLAESIFVRVLLLGILLAFLALGLVLDARAALHLWVLAQALTVVGVLVWLVRRLQLGRTELRPRPLRLYRGWLATSSVMLVTPVFYFLLFETDIIALGILAGPYEVGIYQVARRLAELATFCSGAVSAVCLPRLAQAHAERDTARLQATVDSMYMLGVGSTALVGAALLVLGPWGLALFGPEFAAGYSVLLVLTVGRVLAVLVGPTSDLLLMTGHHRRLGYVNLAVALGNIALNLVLVPRLGGLGAAIATSTAAVGWTLWLYLLARRHTPIEPCLLLRLRRPPAAADLSRAES
ncbi:MAG TPA: oligosaccharide flippase family protein [Geminicoccaceae bacterium]|nr:oligosaccharide flippase family protein [Geminicoccaceae bacterium]